MFGNCVWHLLVALLTLILGACVSLRPIQRSPELADCAQQFRLMDELVQSSGVAWSRARPLADFPHLRADRFLASFAGQDLSEPQFQDWVARLRELDRTGRGYELRRLPADSRSVLGDSLTAVEDKLDRCADRLIATDLANSVARRAIRDQAVVAADYQTAWQVIGLYPITGIPVAVGVDRLQRDLTATLQRGTGELPVHGSIARFRPAPPAAWQLPWPSAPVSPLGIPEFTTQQLKGLFAAHAPVWEIDVVGDHDLPGFPRWLGPREPTVDSSAPVVFQFHSWARWADQVVLQLTYVVWFSERPARGPLDLTAGRLDGVMWRVTLDARGQPLVFDSAHACGCYHMLFPRPGLQMLGGFEDSAEPPLVPRSAPRRRPATRMVVRLASGNHYLQSIYWAAATGRVYRFMPYAMLYTLPDASGRPLGLFQPDGLVAGSERPERWLLWPMGVASAGAMRGRGRHPVAFLARRHFDDPHLFEQIWQAREHGDP